MKIWVPAFCTASILLLGGAMAQAQKPSSAPPTVSPAEPEYPGEPYVIERISRIYTYAVDGTGTKEISGAIAVHNQAGVKALSVLPFDYASSAEHVEIDYVRVRHADGSVVETHATDAQDLPAEVTRQAPFYSDLKQEQIPVRSLREGDHLEYKLRVVRTKPESPGHFWGNETLFTPGFGSVVLSEVVEIHLPKAAYIQVWSPRYKATLSQTATEQIYHWQSAQLKPIAGKNSNALIRMEDDPTLATSDQPRLPSIAWTNFHSWAEVGAWYRSLEGSRTEPDDDVRAKVASLIAGKTTQEEKARAIYGYVAPQVRYIGVAFGIGRYQPHDAGDILRNQYGDCKDKTTLLISMLSAAGIPADAVLIGAGVSFNEAVPSPASFNHAINLAHVDGKPVWLDSTGEVAPYNMLNFAIRGKKSLVIPASGEAHLEITPQDAPFATEVRFDANGTLDDQGTSHSQMVMNLRGDTEVDYRLAVRSVSPAQWDQLMQRISEMMSFAGKVTNAQFSRPDDTAAPFHVAYDYVREKSGDWDNLRILPQLPPVGLADIDEKDPPATPIELGVPRVEVDHTVMKLPRNWTADLPASIHAKSDFATLDKTYKFENGTLITDRRYVVLKQSIPAGDWHAYHQWFKDAGLDGETYVQLNSGSGTATPSVSSMVSENNPYAAELIRQATQAERLRDWSGARAKLDQARETNPNQAYLWSNYGYLEAQEKNTTYAIADYRKELAAHPKEGNVSRLLAGVYVQNKQLDDAIAVLHTAINQNPADEACVLYLASISRENGDLAEAEKTLRAGLKASPESSNLKMRLGIALIAEKKTGEGEAMIREVLTTSDDPSQLNDSAYELANASLDLPLAEKSSRRSLELLDQASNNGQTGPAARQRANLLVSAWDTFGWILYQEGKVAEAEPWVRAAWRNGNTAETGYHLAVILEKENHLKEALTQIDLASYGERGVDPTSVQKLIEAKRAELVKAGVTAESADARMALQQQRTYSFSRGKGEAKPTGQGWAKVEMEITPLAVTDFWIVEGDQTLQPLIDTVRQLKLDLDLPPDGHAKLLRSGILSCHTRTECQLVLVSPRSALSSQ